MPTRRKKTGQLPLRFEDAIISKSGAGPKKLGSNFGHEIPGFSATSRVDKSYLCIFILVFVEFFANILCFTGHFDAVFDLQTSTNMVI